MVCPSLAWRSSVSFSVYTKHIVGNGRPGLYGPMPIPNSVLRFTIYVVIPHHHASTIIIISSSSSSRSSIIAIVGICSRQQHHHHYNHRHHYTQQEKKHRQREAALEREMEEEYDSKGQPMFQPKINKKSARWVVASVPRWVRARVLD